MTQEKSFEDWSDGYMVCTEFSAAYKRANPQAVIKYGKVEGDEHAWVYDPDTNRTIDATLSQWDGFKTGCENDDWWPGENHPIANETDEYDTVESFAKGPGGTQLIDKQ